MGKKVRRFDQAFLDLKLAETGATLLGEYKTLNSYSMISFVCSYGNEYTKRFGVIPYGPGARCKECTKKIRRC